MSPPDNGDLMGGGGNQIQPPSPGPDSPDQYTQRGLDMTAPYAEHRVFFIDTKRFKYGTKDQGHAAAVVLSAALLIIISIFGAVILLKGGNISDLGFLMSPFSLVAGVAIGKSISEKKSDD